jgi:hypothetical protein
MAGLDQQPYQRFITLAVWEELPSLVVFGFMLDQRIFVELLVRLSIVLA